MFWMLHPYFCVEQSYWWLDQSWLQSEQQACYTDK